MRYIPKRIAKGVWYVWDWDTNTPVYDDEGNSPIIFDHDAAVEFAHLKNIEGPVCDRCDGTGSISYNPNLNPNDFPATATVRCGNCNGTGYVRHPRYGKPSCPSDDPVRCPECSLT